MTATTLEVSGEEPQVQVEATVVEAETSNVNPDFKPLLEVLLKPEYSVPGDASHSLDVSFRVMQENAEIQMSDGTKKLVSLDTLLDILGRAVGEGARKQDLVEIPGMLMPSNVFYMGINKSRMELNVYHPGVVKDMLYNGNKKTVVTPNIIISFILTKDNKAKADSDWLITQTRYFCTDLPVPKLPKGFIENVNPGGGIYLFPFSNTYAEGHMCYGSNQPPPRFKADNLRAIDWYYKFLWEGSFNDDLGIKALASKWRERVNPRMWYTVLEKAAKDNKPFPYPDLSGWHKREGAMPSEGLLDSSGF